MANNNNYKPHRLPPMAEANNKLMEVIISPSVSDMESKLGHGTSTTHQVPATSPVQPTKCQQHHQYNPPSASNITSTTHQVPATSPVQPTKCQQHHQYNPPSASNITSTTHQVPATSPVQPTKCQQQHQYNPPSASNRTSTTHQVPATSPVQPTKCQQQHQYNPPSASNITSTTHQVPATSPVQPTKCQQQHQYNPPSASNIASTTHQVPATSPLIITSLSGQEAQQAPAITAEARRNAATPSLKTSLSLKDKIKQHNHAIPKELLKREHKSKQVHSHASMKSLQAPRGRGRKKLTVTDDRSTSSGKSKNEDEMEKSISSEDLLGTRLKALKLRRDKIVSDFLIREQNRRTEEKRESLKKGKSSMFDFASKRKYLEQHSVQDISRDETGISLLDTKLIKEHLSQTSLLADISIDLIDKQSETENTGKTKDRRRISKTSKADIHRDKSDATLRKKHRKKSSETISDRSGEQDIRKAKRKIDKNEDRVEKDSKGIYLSYADTIPPFSSKRMYGEMLKTDVLSHLMSRANSQRLETELIDIEDSQSGATTAEGFKRSSFTSSASSRAGRQHTDLTESDSFTSVESTSTSRKRKPRKKSGSDISVSDISKAANRIQLLFLDNREKQRDILDQVGKAQQILKLMRNRDVVKDKMYTDVKESSIPTSSEKENTSVPSVNVIPPDLESWKSSAEVGSLTSTVDHYDSKKEIADYKKYSYKSTSERVKEALLKDGKDDIKKTDSRKDSATHRRERTHSRIYEPTPEGMLPEANIEGQLSSDLGIETRRQDRRKLRTPKSRSTGRDRKSSDLTNKSRYSVHASSEDIESSSSSDDTDLQEAPGLVPIAAKKKRYLHGPTPKIHTIGPSSPGVLKQPSQADTMRTDMALMQAAHLSSKKKLTEPQWRGDSASTRRDQESTISSRFDEGEADPKISAQQYIQSNGIYELFQLLTTKLITATPDKPLDFLIQEVRDILAKEKCKG